MLAVLMSDLPCWYSMATSKTATTSPAANSDHPNSVKEPNRRLHPVQIEDVRPHIAHPCEKVRDSVINGFVEPSEHRIPYGVGDLCSQILKGFGYSLPD